MRLVSSSDMQQQEEGERGIEFVTAAEALAVPGKVQILALELALPLAPECTEVGVGACDSQSQAEAAALVVVPPLL